MLKEEQLVKVTLDEFASAVEDMALVVEAGTKKGLWNDATALALNGQALSQALLISILQELRELSTRA